MAITLTEQIFADGFCSVDNKYGPWASVDAFKTWMAEEQYSDIKLGTTIGVTESGTIVEYWNPTNVNTFVKKQVGSSTYELTGSLAYATKAQKGNNSILPSTNTLKVKKDGVELTTSYQFSIDPSQSAIAEVLDAGAGKIMFYANEDEERSIEVTCTCTADGKTFIVKVNATQLSGWYGYILPVYAASKKTAPISLSEMTKDEDSKIPATDKSLIGWSFPVSGPTVGVVIPRGYTLSAAIKGIANYTSALVASKQEVTYDGLLANFYAISIDGDLLGDSTWTFSTKKA